MPMSNAPSDAVPGWPDRHYCPVAIPLIHATSGAPKKWTKDCDSFQCEAKCAEKNKRDVLDQARVMFRRWESVSLVVIPNEGRQTKDRIRQWKHRAGGAEVLWVDQDREVHVYSDCPLVPAMHKESVPTLNLDADEGIERLGEISLRLPGVVKTKPSPRRDRAPSTRQWRNPLGHPASPAVVDGLIEAIEARFPGLNQAATAEYSPDEVCDFAQETYLQWVGENIREAARLS